MKPALEPFRREAAQFNQRVERTAAPRLRSTPGGNSGVPCTLHRPSRRRSLTFDVGHVGQRIVATFASTGKFDRVPTILRIGSFRFHFYSDEGDEPPHVHIRTPEGECKFWLDPAVGLARNRGVRLHDLRGIEQLVFEHREKLKEAYDEYHNR